MPQNTKIAIAAAAVLVIAGGVYLVQTGTPDFSGIMNGGVTANNDSTSLPSGSDESDAALNDDMASIGANMQGLDDDSAQVDQSVAAQESGSDF
jgi:hypothetical protein